MNSLFLAAAAFSVSTTSLHFFLGGKQIARPLLDAASLSDEVRYVQYFCWHIATIALGVQAVLFGVAALIDGQEALAIVATGLAIGIGALGIAIPLFARVGYRTMPQGWLFVPVAGLGLTGLFP